MATTSRTSSIAATPTSRLSRVSSLSTTSSHSSALPNTSTTQGNSQPSINQGVQANSNGSTSARPPVPQPINGTVGSPVSPPSSAGVPPQQAPSRSATATSPAPGAPSRSFSRTPTGIAFSYWNDWWIWEITAGLVSVASLLAICIVLAVFDGHAYPKIDWGITLNAVIALLTTIMKAGFMTLLAEGTSQLKWLTFAKGKRPLHDFNVYDAASRGGFGSLRLLIRLRKTFWRELVALAAVFFIVSIAVDTFSQQLIQTKYADDDIGADDAILARNERYDGYIQLADNQGSLTPNNLASDMSAAVYSGIYGTSTLTQDLFTCPSGNCTYPLTPSLAVCGECNNLQSHLIQTNQELNYWTLPNGPTIDEITLMNVTSTAKASQTVTFQDAGTIIAAFRYVNGSGDFNSTTGKNIVPLAGECALWVCVQVYDASVVNGVLSERVVHSFNRTAAHADTNGTSPDDHDLNWAYDFQIITSPDLIPGAAAHSTFNITPRALLGLQLKVPPLFEGNMNTGDNGLDGSGLIASTDIVQRVYDALAPGSALISNLAASMTSSMRRNPAKWLYQYFGTNDTFVPPLYSAPVYSGTAYRTVPKVHIVWPWIALPAAAVLFANLYLIYAMIKTHWTQKTANVGVWKSSQIPLLYHGLDQTSEDQLVSKLGSNPTIGEMEEYAKDFDVRLLVNKDGNLQLSA